MKKRKGFTLIESLAVIVILGILSLIVVPVVTTTLENSRNRAYDFQINNIITGAKSWAAENVMILPEEEGESITITLGQLKMAGHVKKDIKDPRTGELFPDDMEIVITWLMNDYEFRVVEGSGTPGGEYDPSMPTITLIGQTNEYVEINEPYIEKGVIANDPTGAIIEDITVVIKSNVTVVDAVDTTRFGQYTITYSVTYNGKTVSVIRTVTIRDTQLPLLTVPGPIEIEVNEVATFDLMEGVSASDNSGEPPTITISGSLSAIPGIYTIIYTAEDTKGNKTIKTRQITVVNNIAPIITNIQINANEIGETSFTITRSGNASDDYSGLTPNPYKYQISTDGSAWTTKCTNNSTNCQINNLITNTTYHYRLCVVNNAGNEACVESKTVKTLEETIGTITDSRDGKAYKTVKIGNQWWFAENLKYTGNGCLNNTWDLNSPYNSCSVNGIEIHYQFEAAMNGSTTEGAQGICPTGWHIPTDTEWTILVNYAGGESIAGKKLKLTSGNGTDEYGFNALLIGYRSNGGTLQNVGSGGNWWSSSLSGSNPYYNVYAWMRYVHSSYDNINRSDISFSTGLSVRCIRD